MTDTIFALSSGQPPAAIAIMRISGPDAFAAVATLTDKLPPARHAGLRRLSHSGVMLDDALVLLFPGPATATGEDLAELHLHGGRAVVRAVEASLASLPALRPAEAGEFTRRALTHGRIDLTEAEGLGDLLAAETEGQRRAALRAAEGGIRRQIEGWAQHTLALSATVEAMLDHGDEEDVAAEADTVDTVVRRAVALGREIEGVIAQPGVERLRDGLRVVLAGAPNAGKSTLLNALCEREAAIVSPLAGTTRDRIEVPVMRDGVAYVLTDTAGLHDSPVDVVEQIGIERARQSLAAADIILWLDDGAPPEEVTAAPHLLLHPRCDEAGRRTSPIDRQPVSARSGEGITELWEAIGGLAANMLPAADSVPMNKRQRDLASNAAQALLRTQGTSDSLLIAEELRQALRCFDRITGRADTEAMLDTLFGRFCIGK